MQNILHRIISHPKKGYGIHSPFVFNFQREVLYQKNKNQTNEGDKVANLLFRMLSYFKLEQPLLLTSEYHLKFDLQNFKYDTLPLELKKYDLVVMEGADSLDENYLAKKTFVVLTGKHKDILKNPLRDRCRIFLDLYTIGICVFREGLSKEEFKLKL